MARPATFLDERLPPSGLVPVLNSNESAAGGPVASSPIEFQGAHISPKAQPGIRSSVEDEGGPRRRPEAQARDPEDPLATRTERSGA